MSDKKKTLPQFGSREKCARCSQTVYIIEKVAVEGKTTRIFHNYCLRCARCDKVVTLGNYVSLDEQIYCKPHYNVEMQERRLKAPVVIVNKKSDDTATPTKVGNKTVTKDITDSESEGESQPPPSRQEVREEVVHEEEVLSELSE